MTVHDSAALGYAAAADTYARGRPGYPAAVVRWLRDVLGVGADSAVLELGAGTGKFLPLLRETGARLSALEPVAAMRERLIRAHPDVAALAGTADAIPLPDAALDVVVCAQAFHWFATRAALAEIARVLRPGGMLGLVWNVRDESVPWVAALTAIVDPFEADTPRYRTGAWRSVFPAPGFAAVDERQVPHRHVGTPERVIVDRAMSVSFVAALPAAARDAVATRVRALIAATPELADAAEVAFPYVTVMVAYRRVA